MDLNEKIVMLWWWPNCFAILFFDDYDVDNHLGSHSGILKLEIIYLTIPCIPIYHQSFLSNIFLYLLFHTFDWLQFGNHNIYTLYQ